MTRKAVIAAKRESFANFKDTITEFRRLFTLCREHNNMLPPTQTIEYFERVRETQRALFLS